jgi:hypothetical protein
VSAIEVAAMGIGGSFIAGALIFGGMVRFFVGQPIELALDAARQSADSAKEAAASAREAVAYQTKVAAMYLPVSMTLQDTAAAVNDHAERLEGLGHRGAARAAWRTNG